MAHAYVVAEERETGIGKALAFVEGELALSPGDPDIVILRHGLFTVDDARKLLDIAIASARGHKAIIVSAERLFHEAQNALLKLFEEPPQGVTLILNVPSEGLLLPTLRSRLAPLPSSRKGNAGGLSPFGIAFLRASGPEREKMIAKLVDRSRSDKDEEKQAARSEAVRLAEDLMRASAIAREGKRDDRELRAFADDLLRFLPLLHTRSAPLKLIFEHLLIVIPTGLGKSVV